MSLSVKILIFTVICFLSSTCLRSRIPFLGTFIALPKLRAGTVDTHDRKVFLDTCDAPFPYQKSAGTLFSFFFRNSLSHSTKFLSTLGFHSQRLHVCVFCFFNSTVQMSRRRHNDKSQDFFETGKTLVSYKQAR